MKLSELIADCQECMLEYGDLDVGILQNEKVYTPFVCHSENDYFEDDFCDHIGVSYPIIILDVDEEMEFDDEDFDDNEDFDIE